LIVGVLKEERDFAYGGEFSEGKGAVKNENIYIQKLKQDIGAKNGRICGI